jgi:hypothetical protein
MRFLGGNWQRTTAIDWSGGYPTFDFEILPRSLCSGLIIPTLRRLDENRPPVSVNATATNFQSIILSRTPRASNFSHSLGLARTIILEWLATSSGHSSSCKSRSKTKRTFLSNKNANPEILTGYSDKFLTTIPAPHKAPSVPSKVLQWVGDFWTTIRSWSRLQVQYATIPVNRIVGSPVSTAAQMVNLCSGVIRLARP